MVLSALGSDGQPADLLVAAAQSHGPPHVLIVGVLALAVAVAVAGWLVYRSVSGRRTRDDEVR